jgi:fatty acid desaturase
LISRRCEPRRYVRHVRLADWFGERSPRGMLTRAAGAWVVIGLPVIAARLWWSVPAALTIFVLGVTVYVAAAVRHMRRHRQPST